MMTRKSKHHIIPKSRGGDSHLENLAIVSVKQHQAYHTLFDNRTPEEIVEYLNKTFWRGNYQVDIYVNTPR
jgi:5-methylcytosine-specific restriction endonuclease McrA